MKIDMKKESQNIEHKQGWRDEYLKWICGFANAQGGTIFEHKNTIRNLPAAQKSILNYLKLYPKAVQNCPSKILKISSLEI